MTLALQPSDYFISNLPYDLEKLQREKGQERIPVEHSVNCMLGGDSIMALTFPMSLTTKLRNRNYGEIAPWRPSVLLGEAKEGVFLSSQEWIAGGQTQCTFLRISHFTLFTHEHFRQDLWNSDRAMLITTRKCRGQDGAPFRSAIARGRGHHAAHVRMLLSPRGLEGHLVPPHGTQRAWSSLSKGPWVPGCTATNVPPGLAATEKCFRSRFFKSPAWKL